MYYTGNYTEIQMTLKQAHSVSHSGQCDTDVLALLKSPNIRRQLDKIDPDAISRELAEYGSWSNTELADPDENLLRFIWLAGCDIAENND